MPYLIDTHSHLNLEEFSQDWKAVAGNSIKQGVFMINAGVDYATSVRAVEIAESFDTGVYAAIGLHPENIVPPGEPAKINCPLDYQEFEFNKKIYFDLAQSSKKIVAIGEIGLDYGRLPKEIKIIEDIKSKQNSIFQEQLSFAREINLPVILHSRQAHDDTIQVLRAAAGEGGEINGVIHCFTGSVKDAGFYYDLGLYFGLNGIIFKLNLDEAIAQIPLNRILLETDCPYLSPCKEIKRNEPSRVLDVARRIAQIRGDSLETIIESTTQNAQKLFGI